MNTPDLATLGTELKNIGVLIGLLTNTDGGVSFNTDCFTHPTDDLQKAFNWPNLKPVAESFLGKAKNLVEGMGGGPFNEDWYPLSIDDDEGGSRNSGFYLVQKTVGGNALLGIGLHRSFTMAIADDECVIDPFLFIPIFQMPAVAGVSPVFAIDQNGPIEIGVGLTSSATFLNGYNGMVFVASFNFSSIKPDISFLLSKPNQGFVNVPSVNKTDVFNAILNLKPVAHLMECEVLPDPSVMQLDWATLLNAIGWVTTVKAPYQVGNISIAEAPGALQNYIVTSITTAFNKFLNGKKVFNLISNETKGDEKDEKESEGPKWKVGLVVQDNRYGINVQINDVCVQKQPLVNLQLGALTSDGTDWITEAGGEEPTGLGFNFFILSGTPSTGIKFDPQFEALSIGVDISNTDDQPLFDINGYSLKQAQLRGYFSTLQGNAWGVAAALNGVAMPLGPASATSGGGVPQTLLASADAPADEADTKPVVNPEFSLLAAYVNSFYLQLFDADGQPTEIVTIPIQKAFGPVALRDVGIGWKGSPDYQLLFQLDGGLNLNALKLNLDKLTVGVPVQTPGDTSKYTLGLEGFDLSFTSGSVSLAGGFIKDDSVSPAQYNGAVAIQAAKWGITALGSFASVQGHPSLFIFGVLNAALGGPPVFFVTAVAVGFGYNRKIIMPAIDQVQNFPFVKAAVQPDLFSGDDPNEVLTSISQYVPPEMGQYWFAAGVKFTSFELLNSFALLILQFGNKCEIDVLGLSTLQLPKQYADPTLSPYVNAQMAIKATFEPDEGILAVEGQLTDNSFVIDPDCKISGGFAYYSWFSGEHAGDFVVTLGGYNQNFNVPAHYPTVPRLAFNWNVSSSINLSGEAYFALTPSCIMAGGKLSLTYSDGDLQAWFKAFADFLIQWKPFHYDIAIGITIGVSYRVNLLFVHKTISVELGVKVQLWGPEFGGQAHVSLWIISFTIDFGTPNNNPNANIEWGNFQKYFLPGCDTEQEDKMLRNFKADPGSGDASGDVITINVSSGLKDTYKGADGNDYWIVDPGTFAFNTATSVPATKISFAPGPGGSTDAPAAIPGNPFGIKPVGLMTLSGNDSNHTIKLTKQNNSANGYSAYSINNWETDADVKNVPQALWGSKKGAEGPSADVVPDITMGMAMVKPPLPGLTGPPAFPLLSLAFTRVATFNLPLNANGQLKQFTLSSTGSLDQIANINTIAKQPRSDIFAALADLGSLAKQNGDLSQMALAPQNIFQGSPMLANANARPVLMATKMLSANPKPKLRSNAVLPGHLLKATIVKYNFGQLNSSGNVLRGGRFGTQAFKSQNTVQHKNGPGRYTLSLIPGMLQVWELSSLQGNDRLYHNGSLPLRMILFDSNLEIIEDTLISSGKAGNLNIHHNAAKMCLQALDHNDVYASLSGWHQDSYLSLVNPKYLVGKSCMVRSRNPQLVGSNQYKHDTGLVNGRSVVLNNKPLTEGEKLVKGWIETRFKSSIKKVFVLAREEWSSADTQSKAQFNMSVRLIYTNQSGTREALLLTPDKTGINDNELWARFTIPEGVNFDEHFSIWAEAETDDKMQLAGVAGCGPELENWTKALSDELIGAEPALSARNMKLRTSVGLQDHLNL